MLSTNLKRHLAFVMAMVLVLSAVPFQAFAAETGTEPASAPTTEPTTATETTEVPQASVPTETEEAEAPTSGDLLQAYQEQVDALLIRYLGATVLTEEEIYTKVAAMTEDSCRTADQEITAQWNNMDSLSEDELSVFVEQNQTMVSFANFLFERLYPNSGISTASTSNNTFIDGLTIDCSDDGTGAASTTVYAEGSTYTVTVQSGYTGNKSSTITFTNSTDSSCELSFDYTLGGTNPSCAGFNSSGGTFKATISANSTYSDGNTYSITATASWGKKTAVLTMSNFSYTPVTADYTLTLDYDTTAGSIAVTNGTPNDDGTYAVSPGTTPTLTATPKSGYIFLGWVDAERKPISASAQYSPTMTGDLAVYAIFASASSAWFLVNKSYYIEGLNEAVAKAVALGGDKLVTLANSGTLAAGTYTIPSGVTLLIPFDDAHTLYTDKDEDNGYTENGSIGKPYRTLTMANGANLIVEGTVSLSASQNATSGQNIGHPVGNYSKMILKGGSNITIKSGGKLYAWGFICRGGSGDEGTVTVNSGGTVYENLQITDWRGGNYSSNMVNNDKLVFPFSQYYVQNIEVPLTLESGAVEKVCTSLYADLKIFKSYQVPTVTFMGPDSGLFQVHSGSLTKDYNEENDRLDIDLNNGSFTFSKLDINLSAGTFSVNINSNNYVLPITNMQVTMNSGSSMTCNQDMALIPGSSLIIHTGATLTLGTVTNSDTNTTHDACVYVYDKEEWFAKCYAYAGGAYYNKVNYAPGQVTARAYSKDKTPDAEILINGKLTGGYVYSTDNDANIYSTANGIFESGGGTATVTYQNVQAENYSEDTYSAITVTPAVLQNASGEDPANVTSTTGTYTYKHGEWDINGHTPGADATCTTAQTCSCDYVITQALGHTAVIDAAVLPTFTTAGKSEGSHCSVCNEILTEQTEINAARIDSTDYTTLQAALAAAGENGTVTLLSDISGDCPISQEVTVQKNGHKANIVPGNGYGCGEQDGVVTVWKLFKISGTSVRAGDCLDIYFFIEPKYVKEGYVAKVTRMKSGIENKCEDVPASDWETSGDYLRFPFRGIAAKEMTDIVTITICDANGNQVSETFQESVAGYAMRSLNNSNNTNRELQTALVDMLNYGAAAQAKFDYRTTDLANAKLTDTQKAYATDLSTMTFEDETTIDYTDSTYTVAGATVTAESNLYFNFYFNGITQDTLSEFSADLSYVDHYKKAVSTAVSGSDFDKYSETGPFGPGVKGLAIADGRQMITCVLKDTSGNTLVTVESSVESYIAATVAEHERRKAANEQYDEELVVLCKNLLAFVDSAYAYFH